MKKAVKDVEGRVGGKVLDVLINNVGMMENTPGVLRICLSLTDPFPFPSKSVSSQDW